MSRTDVTNITVVNNTQFIEQVNSAGKTNGMTPVPNDTPVTKAAQAYETSLIDALTKAWAAKFPNLDPNDIDSGLMQPYSANVGGTAPQCALDLITQDFQNWNIPTESKAQEQIAKTITEHLQSNGGVTSSASGSFQVNSNQSIAWMARFGEFSVTASQNGVIYAFTAANQF